MPAEKIEDLSLVQLRGLRLEIAALLEHQATFSKQMLRLFEHVDKPSDEVRAQAAEVRKDFREVKPDIILLESQNISRHGEAINALRCIKGLATATGDFEGPK
jgi:uncharacterized coiled-coil DUF342 family protein